MSTRTPSWANPDKPSTILVVMKRAAMPASLKFGTYYKIAVVETFDPVRASDVPAIDIRGRNVKAIHWLADKCNAGVGVSTGKGRCATVRALRQASEIAADLRQAAGVDSLKQAG